MDSEVEFDSDMIDERYDSNEPVDKSSPESVIIRKSFPESWIFDTYSDIGYEFNII